jgi:two-component sensor histidine kinase
MERSPQRLRMSVHDDGEGLPEDFGPSNTGLGLQIVRELVEGQLGGLLQMDTDGGTRVVVDVPTQKPLDFAALSLME